MIDTFAPTQGEQAPSQEVQGKSPWQLFWVRFRRDKVAMVSAAFIIFLTLSAFLAPLFAHYVSHHGPFYFPTNPTAAN